MRALRFGWAWKAGAPGVREEEVEFRRGDRTLPATLLHPPRGSSNGQGWVVLHEELESPFAKVVIQNGYHICA